MSVDTASYADLLVMVAALKEENEALKHDLTRQVEIGSELATENERLKAMNEKLATPNLKSMHIEGDSLEMVLEGGAAGLLLRSLAHQFKTESLGNYVELQFHDQEIGAMTVTIQRVNGQTPGMKAGLLAAERDAFKARVAELESIIGSDELRLVLSNYKNSTLVPRHYRICESILKKIEILNSVAVRDSGCSVIRAPLG